MPTPFTHLRILQDLLADPELAPPHHALLRRQLPAFQLGSIVADARVSSGIGREVTHFYAYGEPISERPWRLMLRQHPALRQPRDEAQLAFLAGYCAHLAADEAWTLQMVEPRFWGRDWQGVARQEKIFALHLILTVMDERDQAALQSWQADSLRSCQPCAWLPFMADDILRDWRDLVARQLAPGGISLTLDIFAARLGLAPAALRAALDSPARMRALLWRHVPKAFLAQVERDMYAFTRGQMACYVTEYLPALPRGYAPCARG